MAKSAKNLTVKRVFGSLINNSVAVDGAKFSPWWVALLMFIFGLLLPVVPLFVQSATSKGSSFMSSAEYGLGLDKTFGQAINELDGALTFNNTDKTINFQPNSSTYSAADSTLIGGYIATSGTCKDQYELRIYYSDSYMTEAEISNFIQSKEGISYTKGTTTPLTVSSENSYTPSSIYFFKNTFYMDIYASNSTEKKAYMGFTSDLTCLDYSGSDLKAYFCGASFDETNKDNRLAAVDKLKEFIDVTYQSYKTKSMWLGSLIYLGVYAGINFFMALMIFISSRGKNNPNNYLSFWTCIKIDWWASLCPGILGLILGFIFSSNAVMLYVMLIAFRSMWLTMREMRPQYQ